MKQLRIVFAAAMMALAAFSVASAQDATATPAPVTEMPAATAAPEMATPEATNPAYMGIQFEAADTGVMVVQVMPDSPAESAGLMAGDIVTAINGVAVTEANAREIIQGFAVGDSITAAVTRDAESLSLKVVLGEMPAELMLPEIMPRMEMRQMARPRLGISIGESENGVIVNDVEAGSPAEAAGLLAGDIITAINDVTVATPQEAAEAVAQAVNEAAVGAFNVTVNVTRGDETLALTATVVKPEMPRIPEMRDFGRRGPNFDGMGMGGFAIVPREGEEGAYDLSVPFRPADPAAVTEEVTGALAALGIRIVPREDQDGLFDLYVPAESLGETEGGFILPHLQMFEGMLPDGFEFHFGGPMGRGFNFEIPHGMMPTEAAPAGESST